MKSFLTIRGNLVFINIVVIGLISWLTISFLHLAVAQRNDALKMQESTAIEKTIFNTNASLVHERDLFFNFLHSMDESSAELLKRLKAACRESDRMLEVVDAKITRQIDDFAGLEKLPATRLILQEQLTALQQRKAELAELRKESLAISDPLSGGRNTSVPSALFEKQAEIVRSLADLAQSFRLLPNADPASIAHYNNLIDEILVLDVGLARMSTVLNKAVLLDSRASSEEYLQIAVSNQQIEQSLNKLVFVARATDSGAHLAPIAEKARRVYRDNFLPIAEELRIDLVPQALNSKNLTELHSVLIDISSATAELAEATHSSTEVLVDGYATSAFRYLSIDICLVALCLAITAASVALNRRLKECAFHDSLTQLHNRQSFESTLRSSSAGGTRMQAVIFLDLDKFKSINDNYGHALGDELLLEVASRLKRACKNDYLPARLGGDEFAVFVDDASSELEVEEMASNIVESMNGNFVIRDLTLNVGVSAGVSIAPVDCPCGIDLLKNADIAMYHSKVNKIDGVYRFNQGMADSYNKRLELEADLRKGIENKQFELVYQPKVCTESGCVKSVEALLRWSHPELGMISPAQFIPLAEENGLMGTIGQWALNEACREIAQLQATTSHRLQVAVNISAQQFGNRLFVESIIDTLEKHGLLSKYLELEVTESIVMTDVERVISMLNVLKKSGVSIAIDDFGTGYSSLQYLQKLPLDTLKIDRAFITELDNHDPDKSVANSIVQLAKLFDLETVAEGVETADQDVKIRSLGVHHIQGYLYSRPVSGAELPAVLDNLTEQGRQRSIHHNQRAA